MAKYLLAFHGGGTPETEEEGAKVMAAWGAWMEGIGSDLVDPGNPTGASVTVTSSGTTDGGGANPLSGYTLISAADLEAAAKIAAACPIVGAGGSVEVAETIDM
jgi:hypothetical protein